MVQNLHFLRFLKIYSSNKFIFKRKEAGRSNSKSDTSGGVDLPVPNEKQINIPIFSGQTFPFDYDVSPAVQRFESVQVS